MPSALAQPQPRFQAPIQPPLFAEPEGRFAILVTSEARPVLDRVPLKLLPYHQARQMAMSFAAQPVYTQVILDNFRGYRETIISRLGVMVTDDADLSIEDPGPVLPFMEGDLR